MQDMSITDRKRLRVLEEGADKLGLLTVADEDRRPSLKSQGPPVPSRARCRSGAHQRRAGSAKAAPLGTSTTQSPLSADKVAVARLCFGQSFLPPGQSNWNRKPSLKSCIVCSTSSPAFGWTSQMPFKRDDFFDCGFLSQNVVFADIQLYRGHRGSRLLQYNLYECCESSRQIAALSL